jgi:type IV pilus assembly protein PilO
MNDILEQFSGLKTSYKMALVVLILGLSAAINYFLFFEPLETEYNSLLNKRSSLEEKKIEYDAKSKTLEMDKKINRDIDKILNEKKGRLPDTTDIEKVIATLDRKAEQAGVKINDIKPGDEIVQELYVEKPIKISVNGSFHELLNFLYMVSKTERIVNMNDIKLSAPEYKNQKVLINADLVIKVYRFKKESEGKDLKKKDAKKKK